MVEQALQSTGVIAIVRGVSAEFLSPLLEALVQGGIRLAEVTLNSPDALGQITEMRRRFEGRLHIGAGTVLNFSQATAALQAGAEFLVTPNIDREVIELCQKRNVVITPGALTPTEIEYALRCGSRYVKVFPASAFGPKYFKEVLAPLSSAKLIAVGGINAENAAQYIQNGAVGVGAGGSLCNLQRILDGDFAGITRDAKRLVEVCARAQ